MVSGTLAPVLADHVSPEMAQIMEAKIGPLESGSGCVPGPVQGPRTDGMTVQAGEQPSVRLGADRSEALVDVRQDVLGNGHRAPPSLSLRRSCREPSSFELDPRPFDGE